MKTKPFLILQLRPEDETADNEFESFLDRGGLSEDEVKRIRVEQEGIPELDLSRYSGIIVGGSPFDVSTPEHEKSELQQDVERAFAKLLDEVVDMDMPFLGACSGCGLLGNYCGSTLSGRYKEPVGGVDVSLTDEGKRDPLLAGVPETFRALVGHKEACDATPPGTVLLATSSTCPVQMFRVKNNVYATQFHPEADAEAFKLRIDIYKHHGYFSPDEADELKAAVEQESTPHPKKILENFVKRYRAEAS